MKVNTEQQWGPSRHGASAAWEKLSSQWEHNIFNFTFCANAFFQMVVKYMYSYNLYRFFNIFFVLLLLLIMCGDIEVNPGPDSNKNLVF